MFSVVGLLIIAGVAIISGKGVLKERQFERFDFRNPCEKILSTGNQVCNCYIAINNGGLTGVGLGNSTQKYLYLPEPYTDFIFAIIVEELGLVTGIGIILMYIFILFRILLIGRQSPNNRGAILWNSYLYFSSYCCKSIRNNGINANDRSTTTIYELWRKFYSLSNCCVNNSPKSKCRKWYFKRKNIKEYKL